MSLNEENEQIEEIDLVDKMHDLCQAFFYDHFWEDIFADFRDNWVEDSETNPNSCNFVNWFMDKVEEHLNLHVNTLCADEDNDIWLMVPEMDMGHAASLYKKRYNLKTADPTDAQVISCLLMEHIMEQGLLQDWMDELEGGLSDGSLAESESEEETSDTESEEDSDAWFDCKYPDATCHRCKEKLNGATVVYCGDGCETWYCADCHEDGTDDCPVCDEWANDELVLSLNHDYCRLEGRHPSTNDEDWELCVRGFTEPYSEELYHTLKKRLEERKPDNE